METSGSNLNDSKAGLIARLEGDHAAVCSAQRRLRRIIAECERAGLPIPYEARNSARMELDR